MQEIETLLGRQAVEQLDLDALEVAVRKQVLQHPCGGGQKAPFQEMRPRSILTAVGAVRFQRPYYLCSFCHRGQSPRDVDLDVENTNYSPGVLRTMALGSSSSFAQGREQLEALAGLQVTDARFLHA